MLDIIREKSTSYRTCIKHSRLSSEKMQEIKRKTRSTSVCLSTIYKHNGIVCQQTVKCEVVALNQVALRRG